MLLSLFVAVYEKAQSPQIGSMFLTGWLLSEKGSETPRDGHNPLKVGSSLFTGHWLDSCQSLLYASQSPQSRVNVSYRGFTEKEASEVVELSQSPQIGSMFLTKEHPKMIILATSAAQVAIPSNRVNVSYVEGRTTADDEVLAGSQSPHIGSMFLTMGSELWQGVLPRRNPLKSGQCFLRFKLVDLVDPDTMDVAIPSTRVNVSYSTHLFLRIIGNLAPLFREPHYFYAFLFPI